MAVTGKTAVPGSDTSGAREPELQRGARHEVTSAELFGGSREIRIRHSGDVYTLRQTAKGKLILTK